MMTPAIRTPSPMPEAGETLLIATHNAGKLQEIRAMLHPYAIAVTSAAEHDVPEPEETGETFEANATLKAQHATNHAPAYAALADDSGLEVPNLDGAPGIYSARWAGPGKDFSQAMTRIQTELRARGYEPQGQPARFVCVLALAKSGYSPLTFRGVIDGTLSFPPRGIKGFGYDPVFIPNGYQHTFAEIDPAEKHRISHRANAFAKFIQSIAHQQETGKASV